MTRAMCNLCLFVVSFLSAPEDAAVAKRLAVRGTHLSLVPHPDFGESAGFTGLESKKHEASLMFIEIPTPRGGDSIREFNKSLTAEKLRTRGFILKFRETGKQNGQDTLLLKGEVQKGGRTSIQWVFLMGSPDARVAEVLATAPAGEFPRIEEPFKVMLASVRWEKQLATTIGGRYYALELPAGWKLTKQIGPVDLYSESGRFPIPQGESSLAVTNLNEKPTNFKAFVKANNLERNHYTDLKELESTFFEIDGFDANISHVSAVQTKDGKPVVLQYCYIFTGETTILIGGNRTSKLPKETFEKVCKSWRIQEQDDQSRP